MNGRPAAVALASALLVLSVTFSSVIAQQRMNMWGTPPMETPKFQKGAQGVMMGPNPLLTQRRTEHKRPPSPPTIMANLSNFGFQGWQGSPGSVDALLRVSKSKLDMFYGWEQLDIGDVVAKHDASVTVKTPILYLCAYYPLELTAGQRSALHAYVMSGGMLLINCCGQAPALESVRKEMAAMFPKRPLRILPPDHPVYRSQFKIEQVTWPEDMAGLPDVEAVTKDELSTLLQGAGGADVKRLPRLRGVTIGTRAAVLVSYEDMACGWNQWDNKGVRRYSMEDSNALGANIMTYALSEIRYAQFLARTHEIEGPGERPRQQLVLAQLIHDGNWNPNPSGVPYLLKELAEKTSLAVKFERRQFEVQNPDLFAYPLLYMTGTWSPGLGPAEVAILRRHLQQGGCLIADSGAGRVEFDMAFRKLVGDTLPGSPLKKLPADHPLFTCFHKIDKLLTNHEVEPVAPQVEAVFLQDRPVILYSPIGLSDGWARQHSAFARCYQPEDSLKLTANMIVYLMLTVRQ